MTEHYVPLLAKSFVDMPTSISRLEVFLNGQNGMGQWLILKQLLPPDGHVSEDAIAVLQLPPGFALCVDINQMPEMKKRHLSQGGFIALTEEAT